MRYNILEAIVRYHKGQLFEVIVLVEISRGDIRAMRASQAYSPAYTFIEPNELISDKLLQRIAAQGYTLFPKDTIRLFKHNRSLKELLKK